MDIYEIKAYAKINLGLDVIGTREDGYHLLRMVMQNIGISDKLTFRTNQSGQILIESDNRFLAAGPKNIVYKAIELVCSEYGINEGITVKIEKKIPIAAGLAGGSADAAATLIALDGMFTLGMTPAKMSELGVRLGADVPFCLLGQTALAEGIGEKLTPLTPMPPCSIVLVKPRFGLSTKHVYQEIDNRIIEHHPDIDAIIDGLDSKDLKKVCANMGNVLELVSCAEYPVLEDIKKAMLEQDALGAMMSGSGPTVFGIFDDRDAARQAYKHFKFGEYGNATYLTEPV